MLTAVPHCCPLTHIHCLRRLAGAGGGPVWHWATLGVHLLNLQFIMRLTLKTDNYTHSGILQPLSTLLDFVERQWSWQYISKECTVHDNEAVMTQNKHTEAFCFMCLSDSKTKHFRTHWHNIVMRNLVFGTLHITMSWSFCRFDYKHSPLLARSPGQEWWLCWSDIVCLDHFPSDTVLTVQFVLWKYQDVHLRHFYSSLSCSQRRGTRQTFDLKHFCF